MYTNKTRVGAASIKYMIMIIAGVIGLLFFGVGGYAVAFQDGSVSYMIFAHSFTAVSVLLLIFGIRGKRIARLAGVYGRIFEESPDDLVTLEELQVRTGRPGVKLLPELRKIADKGYFVNCSLETQGTQMAVRLVGKPGMAANTVRREEPVEVVCESCGAKNLIPFGTRGKCEYCGSQIQAFVIRRR